MSPLPETSIFVAYGPRPFPRATGEPVTVNDAFSLSQTSGPFTLRADVQGVSSASVVLNGVAVLQESDFNQQVSLLTREVQVQATNQLAVTVRGKPGGKLTLQITGVSQNPSVKVRAFELDASAPGRKGVALGSGVTIRLNGADVGVTDDSGALNLQVQPGTYEVSGLIPGRAIGVPVNISAAPSQVLNVDVLFDFDRELVQETELQCDELQNQLLAGDFASLTLRFTRNGALVPLKTIDSIDLLRPDGSPSSILDRSFTVGDDGVLRATPAALGTLRTQFQGQPQSITLRVLATGADGLVHGNKLTFYLARYRVTGALAAPPSAPALELAGIPVQASVLGTDLTLSAVSGPGGAFEFPGIPRGLLSLRATTLQAGKYRYGQGETPLNQNILVTLPLRGLTDIRNNVSPLTVRAAPTVAVATSAAEDETLPTDLPPRDRDVPTPPWESDPDSQSTGPVQAAIAGSTPNVAQSASAVLDVPQGTSKVTLKYTVFTAEWPTFVQQQTVFNDTWSVTVFGGPSDQQLFSITRSVNSQWFAQPPFWRVNGTTGTVQESLDVTELAAAQATQLTVLVTAMNVGDSLRPTSLKATLGEQPAVIIGQLIPDALGVFTRNDGTYSSIARLGERNSLSRTYTLRFSKPAGAELSKVRVILQNATNRATLMTVLDEGIGERVQRVSDDTVRVRVSLSQFASTINAQPPPLDRILYNFRMTVLQNGQEITSDFVESRWVRALWRMPDGLPRYGPGGVSPAADGRDDGGDDWMREATYKWLVANQSALSAINDCSGEHARDLHQHTHERGADVDIFHFHAFPGSTTAESNYQALVSRVRQILATGAPDALSDVTAWVSAMRNGLANLARLPLVYRLFTSVGAPVSVQVSGNTVTLPQGWARSLLQTGMVTASNGAVIQTNLGPWNQADNDRIRYNSVSNNHVHISLDVS